MPELPEVETVCRGLTPVLEGASITQVMLYRPDLRIPFPPDMQVKLDGSRITTLTRRSKYLLLHTQSSQHSDTTLIIHLGMSGRVQIKAPEAVLQKHDHVVIKFRRFSGECLQLVYHDVRRFGLMTLCETALLSQHPLLRHLGVEPLESAFTVKDFYAALQHRQSSIKQVIMDASLVVGVGNIYAAESLFRAGIHPAMKASDLTFSQSHVLHEKMQQVLREAIASGGSTLRDYAQSNGELGYFQHHFRVYGQESKPCSVCKTPIQRITQHGRSSFFCPQCQPL